MANIDLLNLEPQVISKNLKGKYAMFYGLPGVGKTSLAA
jgi:replication-associated recombination protein RarA